MNGFLRTPHTARLWLGPLQLQVWRDWFWLVAWNGPGYVALWGSGLSKIGVER